MTKKEAVDIIAELERENRELKNQLDVKTEMLEFAMRMLENITNNKEEKK